MTPQGIRIKQVQTPHEYELALGIRKEVFVGEQGVPLSLEVDEFEKGSEHFLCFLNEDAVATGRLRLKGPYIKFERIAVRKAFRGKGLGALLMEAMEAHAIKLHPRHLPAMHAQESAIPFYLKLGWLPEGDVFLEADIPHRLLVKPSAGLP